MTETLKARALKMCDEGFSSKEICEALRINSGTLHDYKIYRGRDQKLVPDEDKERIDEMAAEGTSQRQIAAQLGIAKSTVANHLRERDPEAAASAEYRANLLREQLIDLVTRSKWPVVDADKTITVTSPVGQTFKNGEHVMRSRAPKLTVNQHISVAKIKKCKNRRFFFTCAQNDTPVHTGLWHNLTRYAEKLGAEIVVGTTVYNTNWWNETNLSAREFDPVLHDYLCFGRMEIGDNFVFAAEMNISPTASAPINAKNGYVKGKWAVFPAARMQLKTAPRMDPNEPTRQTMTSCSITIPNVIPRAAGNEAIHHHVLGFVIVEFDEDGDIFCRHVNAEEDGSFYDMINRVENGKVTRSKIQPDYLMPGDIHRAKMEAEAKQEDVGAIFGFSRLGAQPDNLISLLKPRQVILHDLHDGDVDSHYTEGDVWKERERILKGLSCGIEAEIEGDAAFLKRLEKEHKTVSFLVVESNHDLRLTRYVKEGRFRNGVNIAYGHFLEGICLAAMKQAGPFSLLEHAIRAKVPLERTKWTYDGRSHLINGVEVGQHGFRGTNGSKATLATYTQIGHKISYGDKHSPAILDGAFQGGVIALEQGYNIGPSSWANSLILQYANGKRCMITMNNGKFWFPLEKQIVAKTQPGGSKKRGAGKSGGGRLSA